MGRICHMNDMQMCIHISLRVSFAYLICILNIRVCVWLLIPTLRIDDDDYSYR